jgi:hypothetical protein
MATFGNYAISLSAQRSDCVGLISSTPYWRVPNYPWVVICDKQGVQLTSST